MYLLLALAFLLPLSASDAFLGLHRFDQLLEPKEILERFRGVGLGEARNPVSLTTINDVLSDYDDRVFEKFQITDFFSADVRFWFGVYTQYEGDQIVLHDRDDLDIIYGVLHFSPQDVKGMNRFGKNAVMQTMAQRKIDEIKLEMRRISQGHESSDLAFVIQRSLGFSKDPPPLDARKRRAYYESRAKGVRAQTGQRDSIRAGLERARPYFPFLKRIFQEANLPPELLGISFLESSFNNEAHSRVGALGVWQFMPLIAASFMPRRSAALDYRQNLIISSVAAMHLLRENYAILKRWDLAITAYNSGTKHLVRARRELRHPSPSLEMIFKHYKADHHGFASKNFYSEFIALVHVLDYREELFPEVKSSDRATFIVSVAVCPFVPKALSPAPAQFAELNPHLYRLGSSYPRGTIVVSKAPLPSRSFKALTMDYMLRNKPLRWAQAIANQSCSTR